VKKTKIGFFDSGIGGVTVLKECIKINPDFEYLYYSDSKNNPYGDKRQEDILKIVSDICLYLISQGCYIIVIACNTASAICVDYLRGKYPNVCFIAIEPAIKCVYDCKDKDGTLIIATKGTMDSEKFHALYNKYHYDNFYLKSCSGLANLIENGNIELIKKYLMDNLYVYKGKVKSIVLGCTHYPLIKKEISEILGNVTFYDGSMGVAKQLKKIIDDNGYIGINKKKIIFLYSYYDIIKEKRFWSLLEE